MKNQLFIIGLFLLFSVGLKAQNAITVINPQTSVKVGSSITYNVKYTKTITAPAYVLIRFKSPNGKNLEHAIKRVTANSATIPLTVKAPTATGGNYKIQAQLLKLDWGGLKTYNRSGITVVGNTTSANNSITVLNPQTSVKAGSSVTYNVKYTKAIATQAYVLIRFKAPNGNNLEYAIKKVTANSATIPLTVKAPTTTGGNYKIQAQLLKLDWGGLKNYDRSGITVIGNTTSTNNSITVINPQTSVKAGNSITYNVSYTKAITAPAYVLIRFKGPNGENLEFATKTVTANSATIPLTVKAPTTIGGNYKIHAQLLKLDWGGLKEYTKSGITVVRGSGDDNDDPVIDANGTVTYNPKYTNSNIYNQDLGKGYFTNWFIDPSWLGDMSANFGPARTYSWVEFKNEGGSNGHGEIDLKIQKASWHEDKDKSINRGYPTKINRVTNNLNCTIDGNWSSGSKGRAFINMTAWILTGTEWSNSDRCDIIVHTWDNSGELHEKYATHEQNGTSGLEVLKSFTTRKGVEYHVLKRNGGGNGEAATYNLVPKVNLRMGNNFRWQNNFETTRSSYDIDMKDIINKLIAVDRNSKNPTIDSDWYLHILEWTVVPSGGDTVHNDYIGNAEGKYNIHDYTIPNLIGTPLAKTGSVKPEAARSLSNAIISIYPNPFKDSFTYVYNGTKKESVNVELYSLDGKNISINTINSDNNTVNTSDLSSGVYILRISSDEEVITKKIIKN